MKYQVKRNDEEFQCPVCGFPVYVGDSAYQDGPDGSVYCSKRCCEKEKSRPSTFQKKS